MSGPKKQRGEEKLSSPLWLRQGFFTPLEIMPSVFQRGYILGSFRLPAGRQGWVECSSGISSGIYEMAFFPSLKALKLRSWTFWGRYSRRFFSQTSSLISKKLDKAPRVTILTA